MLKIVALVGVGVAALAFWRRDKVKDDVQRVSAAGKQAAASATAKGKQAAAGATARLRGGRTEPGADAPEASEDAPTIVDLTESAEVSPDPVPSGGAVRP